MNRVGRDLKRGRGGAEAVRERDGSGKEEGGERIDEYIPHNGQFSTTHRQILSRVLLPTLFVLHVPLRHS